MKPFKIGTIINGTEALQCYRDGAGAGPLAWPPEIPEGCNTAWWRFETAQGNPALIIRQTGFRRKRGEGEVNGLSVVIALEDYGEDAFQALESFVSQLLQDK